MQPCPLLIRFHPQFRSHYLKDLHFLVFVTYFKHIFDRFFLDFGIDFGMNFSFRGYWSGVGRTTIYLRTIIVMHIINVPISFGLIFGRFGLPELGCTGAGIGTTVSVIIGSILPMALHRLHLDPAHAGATIQVIMDLAGVCITCAVCSTLLVDDK